MRQVARLLRVSDLLGMPSPEVVQQAGLFPELGYRGNQADEYTPDQIQTFLKELRFFVEMTAVEQHVQMSKKLPSVDEYRYRRMGSSTVRICLAIAE